MRRLVSLVLLGASLGAHAADRATPDRLRDAEARAVALEERAQEVLRNVAQRRGLMGAGEARERYTEAVYQFMVGQYAPAAMNFYVLVQAGALSAPELAADSELYLGECLFELDDYATAAEFYDRIARAGETHPYFADGVRRLLEVYALMGDDPRFDATYKQYIDSGRVKATDLVTYTLGKAFYHRGELPRAQTRFTAVLPDSPYYPRARYFLGAIAVRAGDYPAALEQFRLSEGVPPRDPEGRRVAEAAALALARLHYETASYADAATWYAKVPPESPNYADALRESTWTYIRQDDWLEASRRVDTFLERFPSHRFTAALQVLRGHLGMKLQSYDSALASYEKVVSAYTPVATTLEETAGDAAALRRFTAWLAEENPSPAFSIPEYAEELLRSRADVERSLGAWQALQGEQKGLSEAGAVVRELQLALGRQGEKLQAFLVARQELAQVRNGGLVLRAEALELEGSWLRTRLPGAQRGIVSEVLRERTAVQGGGDTPEAELASRRAQARHYGDLHARLKALRSAVTDPSASEAYARFDALWADLSEVDKALDAAGTQLADVEPRELAAVRQRLDDEARNVSTLTAEVDDATVRAAALAESTVHDATLAVAAGFREDVALADKGIVDVFWLQKGETSDTLQNLAVDLNAAQRELDARFQVLREGMR